MLDDLGDYLIAQGVVSGSTGWTLYKGGLPPDPDKAVAVMEMPGDGPEAEDEYLFPSFQVLVRAGPDDYDATRAKILEVRDTLDDSAPDNFVYIYASHSTEIPLARGGTERVVLAWNFRAMRSLLAYVLLENGARILLEDGGGIRVE